jgi:acyl carrier protein
MITSEVPSREIVVAIVAARANVPEDSVPEQIDSLGVAWLLYEAERRFGISLDLDDELLARMSTVTGAVELLEEARLREAQRSVKAADG